MIPSCMPIVQARAPLPAMIPVQAPGRPFAADLARVLVLLRAGPEITVPRTPAEAPSPSHVNAVPIAVAGIVSGLPLRRQARKSREQAATEDQQQRNDREADHD